MVKYPVGKPFFDDRETRAVVEVMEQGQLTQGNRVAKFESEFAAMLGTGYAVACSSGTAALHLALVALGIGEGDEVLVPDLTYVATANAVAYTGAVPVLCDIDASTWGIDLQDAERRITRLTKAILPVHLYGVPNDMEKLMQFASAFDLMVIEDAAEGLGGYSNAKPLGTWGHASSFSFYANKILATGEGGVVVTDDGQVAKRLKSFRGQGVDLRVGRYWHDVRGFNYRMTELQAAIGNVQLEKFHHIMAERDRVMQIYRYELRNDLKFSRIPGMAPWLFTALVPSCDRDNLAGALADCGIETRPVFTPLHRMPMYRQDDSFMASDIIADNGLSFPTYPSLKSEDVIAIARATQHCLEVIRG